MCSQGQILKQNFLQLEETQLQNIDLVELTVTCLGSWPIILQLLASFFALVIQNIALFSHIFLECQSSRMCRLCLMFPASDSMYVDFCKDYERPNQSINETRWLVCIHGCFTATECEGGSREPPLGATGSREGFGSGML